MIEELKLLKQVEVKKYLLLWFLQTFVNVLGAYYWKSFVNKQSEITIWLFLVMVDGLLIYFSSYIFPQFEIQLYKAFSQKHHNLYQHQDPEYKRTFNTDDLCSKSTEAWNAYKSGIMQILNLIPVMIKFIAYCFQILNESVYVFCYIIVVNIVFITILYCYMKNFGNKYNEFSKQNSIKNQVVKNQYSLYGKFIGNDKRIGEKIMHLESEKIKDGYFRDAFWTKLDSMNNFVSVIVIIPIIYSDLATILVVVYIESLITTIVKNIGIFDYCNTKITPLHSIEAQYITITDQYDNLDVPKNILIKNIEKSYEGRNYKLVSMVDLHIHQGDIIQIVGHSGSGKSSLFGIISGSYKVCYDLFLTNEKINCGFRDFRTGQIIEFQQNVGKSNIVESFRDMASTYINLPNDEELKKVLQIMKLYDWWTTEKFDFDTVVQNVSGGQKSRINIAAALTQLIRNRPKIILFDEITSDIDSSTSTEIWNNIFDEFSGSTILFVNHDKNVSFNKKLQVWNINNGIITH